MSRSTLLTLAAFSLFPVLSTLAGAPVAFDSFEYTGRDPLPDANIKPSQFRNPVLSGFYPDPSLCRVGDDFYLINSTFAYFPGIPIFHSRDLVNWTQVGNVIERPTQLSYDGLGVSRGIFAPAISYSRGIFYVVCTMADAGGNFVVTASNPSGPWSDPTWLHFEGIDPSIFFDDDGRAWLINNGAPLGTPLYPGHRAIWIQEFDPATRRMIGPRTILVNGGVDLSKKPIWIEGPHIFKRNGWYYLCCAEGGTSVNHSQVIFRSRKVDGPYVPWERNPILTQRDLRPTVPFPVTSTGHASLVIGPDNQWWAVFLGVRPYDHRFSPMGRETFLLPVQWTSDDWPVILEPGMRVPLVADAPRGVTVQANPAAPLNGNFTWRDDFTESTLSPLWIMLRAPKETWWKLDGRHGRLLMTPSRELLSGKGNPSFLARRVQHANFSASTTVEVPTEHGVSAGLTVFQGEKYHYFLAVKHTDKGDILYLECLDGGSARVVRSIDLPSVKKLMLRIETSDATCDFAYATTPGEWQDFVKGEDAKILTTEVAGGFVGAVVGMHVRLDP